MDGQVIFQLSLTESSLHVTALFSVVTHVKNGFHFFTHGLTGDDMFTIGINMLS